MSTAEIIALVAAFTALVAAVASSLKQRSDNVLAIKREELGALTTTIGQLESRNTNLYDRVCALETNLETERDKRRELEKIVMAKDARISELEHKVSILEAQLEALEQTPATKRNSKKPPTGPLQPVK